MCEVKDQAIESLKNSHKSKLEKVELWYEEQAEKQKETFLKRLQEQQRKIDALVHENKTIKERNEELSKAIEFPPDTASQAGSIVTQAITSIVGKFKRQKSTTRFPQLSQLNYAYLFASRNSATSGKYS